MTVVGQVIQGPPTSAAPLLYSQFLSLNNDGSTFDASVDGSGTAKNFDLSSDTLHYSVSRILIQIVDSGTWGTDKYGSIAALTNGINLQVLDDTDTVVMNLGDGLTVKKTSDWQRYSYDGTLKQFPSGSDYFVCRWTFNKHGYNIDLRPGYTLRIIINDNLSTLDGHFFCGEGHLIGTSY